MILSYIKLIDKLLDWVDPCPCGPEADEDINPNYSSKTEKK